MKTLAVLLLLAVLLGAAFWSTQRAGEGLGDLTAEAGSAMQRLIGGDRQAGSDRVGREDNQADEGNVEFDGAGEPDVASDVTDTDSAALAKRLDALENEVTRTMTAAEASVVQERLDALDRRMADSTDAAGAQASSGAVADTLVGRLDAIDGRLQLLDRRLDEQDPFARLDELGTRIDALAEQFAARSQALDSKLVAAATERADLAERGDTMAVRLDSFAAGGGAGNTDERTGDEPGIGIDVALDARLAALEESQAGSRADGVRISAFGEQLAELATRLDSLAEQDGRLTQSVSELRGSLEEIATDSRVLSIDSVQQQIADQLANLDADVRAGAGNSSDVGALQDALDATRERIVQLESQVENLPASSSAAGSAQQNQSALESQIAALERRLESLPSEADPALASSLDEMREQVEQLSAQGFVTQDELRAQVEGKNVEYKIYFDKDSVAITDEASRVLDSFIAQETNRTTGVAIFGFTDRRGPASYNQQLAQRRASSVRSYLIQNGFDYTRIGNVAGLGEDAAAALLEDEQEDAQQRVVVLYAGQRQ